MCDVKRCRRTDVGVIYAVTRKAYEICGRCWDRIGSKSAREIIALLEGGES